MANQTCRKRGFNLAKKKGKNGKRIRNYRHDNTHPHTKNHKIKTYGFLLYIFLKFGVILCGVVAFVFYDYFIAIITIMLAFIIVGIIRSKLRNSSIPPQQQEYQYSDKEIAQWFIANHYYN